MAEKRTAEKSAELKFTKEQLAASKEFVDHRDLVNALLEDGKRLDQFKKGKVK